MLALAGIIVGKPWLGSLATHAQSGFGGGGVQTGARIVVEHPEVRPEREGDLPVPDWARPGGRTRVVPGPQERFFDGVAIERFLKESFTLSDAYDRMGVRLKGPELPVNAVLDMPSEPILRGSVQVAGDGVATVLLADHQTTGGYPKIATVIGPDLDWLVQNRSGESIGFTAISAEDAVLAARKAHGELAAYLQRIGTPRGSLTERLMGENLISGVFGDDGA
jgi:allophanate hydrolase